MKAPTYILKNVYQENLIDTQYQKHISKMQNITSKSNQVQQEEQIQMGKINYSRFQKERTRKFKEQQTQMNRQYSDTQLIKKIMSNDQRHQTVQVKPLKSLIGPAQKQQAYEIGLENVRLGKRILHLPSVIKKAEFDKQFQTHEFHKQNASRMRNSKSRQNLSNNTIIKKDPVQVHVELPIQFKLVVFNKELLNKEAKYESLYSVEVLLNEQLLIRTIPINFENLQNLFFKVPLSASQYQIHENSPLILKMWKIKNNSELYMGQTFIGWEDQQTEKDLMKKVNEKEVWNGFIQL